MDSRDRGSKPVHPVPVAWDEAPTEPNQTRLEELAELERLRCEVLRLRRRLEWISELAIGGKVVHE